MSFAFSYGIFDKTNICLGASVILRYIARSNIPTAVHLWFQMTIITDQILIWFQ